MEEQQDPEPPKLFDREVIAVLVVLVALGACTIFGVLYVTSVI